MILERLKYVVVFVLIANACIVVSAQNAEPTRQPDQGIIVRWGYEIIYPAAIRFEITAGLPLSELQSATLVIEPEGRTTTSISVDLNKTAFVGGDNPQFEYVWQLPEASPPLLFRNVTFRWLLSSANNPTSQIEDQLKFFDTRVTWLQDIDIGNNTRLTIPVTTPDTSTPIYSHTGLEQFRMGLRNVTDLLMKNLGTLPQLNILVYGGQLRPVCEKNEIDEPVASGPVSRREVPCDPVTAQNILSDSGYVFLESPTIGLDTIEDSVAEALAKISYEEVWSGRNVPEWFREGLARLFVPSSKADLGASLASAARTGGLLKLSEMNTKAADGQHAEFWQMQSYGMVVYIASQIGTDGLFKLADSIASSTSFDAAYEAAVGRPVNLLISEFNSWIFTNAGVNAFSFSPYRAATFTPTPSRTPTLTPTLTATTTPTLTLTPTVTGVLSLTPLPTNTLTRTPTAAPPTTTPRPAGSLNSPTPEPPTVTTQASQNTLIVGVLLFLGGLVLVAIVALIITRPRGRRRR
ncbi:MAG: hypothetical protein R3E39_05660 [Anaerolineae bacterium]